MKGKGKFSKSICAFFSLVFAGIFVSCKSNPKNLTPVQNFKAENYLGKWYEIARLDFKYEKNLSNVTAEYFMNSDGSIRVLNTGYNYEKEEWKQTEGKAIFVGDDNVAALKVTFFWPFYGGYNVIALDDEYRYALVAGDNLKNLWLLSRTPDIPEAVKKSYLAVAKACGYDTDKLIWTAQNLSVDGDYRW